MELDHFSHEDPKDCVEQLPCFGCSLPLSSPAYKCTRCNFFLHKSCAQLPNKIIHFLHPRHPLTLLAKTPYGVNPACDNCREIIYGFSYHCSLCSFDLDINCVLLQSIVEYETHKHSFMLHRPTSFTCDACGELATNSMSYLCSTCQLMLHKSCASLPDTIKHKAHPHPFTLAQPTTTTTTTPQVCSCKLCGEKVDPSYLGYECVTCTNDSKGPGFKTHVRCTTPKHLLDEDEDDTINTTIDGDENNEPHQTVNDESVVVGMTRLVVENERVIELEHFSHQHCLTLCANEVDPENDEICEGCTRSISAPFYKCGECKFFLHVSCAELPHTMLHPLHPHPLTLLAHKCGVFCCYACNCWSNGFRYNCDKCNQNFDVRCTSFSKTLKHTNHEHILNLDLKHIKSNCNACGKSSFRPKFRCECDDCDFRLDLGCASLPCEVWHRWDKHPLNLTFCSVVEEESEEYYCEICEEEIRDPKKKWFYHCEECNFSIHPKCIIWANMIKFGKKGKNYCRPSHIFRLTYCGVKQPLCYICDQPCTDGYAVECADCNFFIHWLH